MEVKKMKKFAAIILAFVITFGLAGTVSAADVSRIDDYKALFKPAEGPETNGVSVEYMYFEPENDGEKHPVVLYFHGMGQGAKQGDQIASNNIALWASPEMQEKFVSGGAYIIAPRSHEEKGEYWDNDHIGAVKAALDEFTAQRSDSIDFTRIYVGGFSMGGKMTLKMLTSYPDMFAAAFPMCPAYLPTQEQYQAIADKPIWLTVSRFDVIAGWYTNSQEIWNNICKTTNVPGDCRLSLMTTVHFPDGKKTQSNHHVWFAVSNDMFMYDGGKYDNMTTLNANGEEITLTYPDGMISWLNGYVSSYDGGAIESTGLCEKNSESTGIMVLNILKAVLFGAFDLFGTFITTGSC